MHLKVNVICIKILATKETITARCSLWKDFSVNVAIFNVHKWCRSDVIV